MQPDSPPRSEGLLKLFLGAFLIAVFGYVTFFSCDAFLRTRNGAWQFTFESDAAGTPAIIINEPKVGVTNVKIIFSGEQVAERQMATNVALNVPRQPVPFGKVIFDDLMYQPGNVTFDFFGHEIQLLPRVLTVNKKEIPWRANTMLTLFPKDKLPTPPREQQ